ncbi:MAG: tetratricopeptide repeat protein [Desulfurivibrionaceae bacterium]
MMYKQVQSLLTGCLGILLAVTVSAAEQDPGLSRYRQGIEMFRSGDYRQALDHFEAARQEGREGPTLIYNLGVSHYKLEQFGEAEDLFEELVEQYPEWQDLGRYNLGRIAMQRGDDEKAAEFFRLVRRTSSNEKLVHLAGEGLTTLNVPLETTRGPVEKKYFTLLSLSYGFDDNVIAFPDQLQTSSSQGEDTFLEFLGYGQYYISGNRDDGVRLHGFAYSKQYDDLDAYDNNIFSAGVSRDKRYAPWQVEYGADLGYTEVDGDELTTRLKGRLKLGRTLGPQEYTVRYQPIYHDAGSDYSQLDGWQHRLDLRWRYGVSYGLWTLRYRLDYNDRDDLEDGGTFLSYSPLRNSIMAEGQWYASPNLTLVAGTEYTNSQYDDDNRLTDIDGVFKIEERESDEIELWVQGQYQLHPRWQILAEYRYSDHDDTFKLYEYDRNTAKLSIEYAY